MGTTGTSHHDVKGERRITEIMSLRVPMHDTGAEQPVIVRKHL